MVPRRVRLKGFLSYRDEVKFCFDDASLWLLSGLNGSGKSSVFDAITFALYGLHRNGRQNLKELINAQSDSLEVEFDFRTGGKDYRVVRTVSRNESSTFYAACLDDTADIQEGEDADSGKEGEGDYADDTNKKDGLNAWVERIVGLDEKTFTASVLLRQGEGDRILTAKPRERFDMLSRIVNLSHYERLHQAAVRHLNEQNGAVQTLQRELDKHAPYDAAEIERIKAEIARLGTDIEAASRDAEALQKRKEELAELLVDARRYEELNKQVADHGAVIRAMENLLANAAVVRRKAARLTELTGVVAMLGRIATTRGHVKRSTEALQTHHADAQRWIGQISASLGSEPAECSLDSLSTGLDKEIGRLMDMKPVPGRLREYAQARSSWTTARTAEEEAQTQIQALSDALVILKPRCQAAQTTLETATEDAENARLALQEAKMVLRHTEAALKRFNTVSDAQKCSYCGLPLTPEHLDSERASLGATLQTAKQAQEQAQAASEAAENARSTAHLKTERLAQEQKALENEQAQQTVKQEQAQSKRCSALRMAQTAFDALPPEAAAHIRSDPAQMLEQCFASAFPDAKDIEVLEMQTKRLPNLQGYRAPVQSLITQTANEAFQLATYQSQLRDKVAELPDDWRTLGDTFDDAQLKAWNAEEQSLKAENVAEALMQLNQADATASDRKQQIRLAQEELDTIRLEARLPVIGLQLQEAEADATLSQRSKDKERDKTDKASLEARLETIEHLLEQLGSAKSRANRYETLCRHLGPNGLQLYLLRQAEAVIVDNADEILHSISNGMLRLELRTGGVNKALDVVAHNSESGSKPIPVGFLSGSQKFRVAVSLALGIGEYASQGNQCIQSVIIDEGFGSLDKQARGEMIHALQSLTNRLERVIVVSHQDEVTEAFRDRYHICLENGTSTATPVHLA